MRLSSQLVLCGGLLAALVLDAQTAQTPPTPENETKGMPARPAPADYPSQAKAGTVTIAAEFDGHNVPKPEGPLTTEDFVIVEACLFGADGQHLTLSIEDFSLRINGKKAALPNQPYGLVTHSLKDPAWSPPEDQMPKDKSKGGISTGGGRGAQDAPSTPAIVHVPIELQRAMAQFVSKSSMPLGERALPQAGLLFFRYSGNTKSIHSIELTYTGPAGKATLELQP